MFTRNKVWAVAAVFAVMPFVQGQDGALDRTSVKINLPADSPVALVSADWGESRATARGGAMMLDLHTALTLRNSGQRRIRGVTLLVQAQAVTPGGKGSVAVPSLNIGAGEIFPLRIDLTLLRPLQQGSGPLVEVTLDGVLFEDFSFYGPDRLNSRRTMTVWELEAQRDRRYFQAMLESQGPEELQREVLTSLARQSERPRVNVQMARGRATNVDAGREVQLSFVEFPDSPVEALSGIAHVAGNEARAPKLSIRNRSNRPVRHLEVGWIFQDRGGREFLSGSVPSGVSLAPGQKAEVAQDTSLKLSHGPGRPMAIDGITGFVSSVEFADGKMWIPSRASLATPRLERVLTPSPEEQRLTGIYRRKGLAALVEELKKF
jgi:hypothetical protein